MTGYLTGHKYGNLINATYLGLTTGMYLDWSETGLTDEELEELGWFVQLSNRPSWV